MKKLILALVFTLMSSLSFADGHSGKIDLKGFAPVAIGSASTGNTTALDVYITPSSSDVLPLREQIILIENADISITMVDDAGTGTYVQGASGGADGTTLKTGY